MPETLPRGRYFGQKLGSNEMAGVLLTEKWHNPVERIPPHAHEYAYLCFVLEGSWREQYANQERYCRPRSVIYHPAGEIHADMFGPEPARLFTMELDTPWLDRVADTGVGLTQPCHTTGGVAAGAALRIYEEYRDPDTQSALVVEGLMLELIGSLIRSLTQPIAARPPEWLRRARTIIRNEYFSPPRIDSLAHAVGVHPAHLSRAFRNYFGSTVAEYVRSVRVERASQMLASGTESLTTIAHGVGFCDQSHFTKTFKSSTGLTPAQYRAAAVRTRIS